MAAPSSALLPGGGGLNGKPEWNAADAEAALLVSHRPVLPILPLRCLPRLLRAPPPSAGRVFAGPQEGGGPGAGETRPRAVYFGKGRMESLGRR